MTRKLLLFLLLISIGCSEKKEKTFTLIGKTDQIKNGSMLYLHDLVNNKTIDSAVVESGTFKFSKPLPHYPLLVMLHSKDRSKFAQIWLENHPMSFDATNAEFSKAKITGSRSNELIKDLYRNMDLKDREKVKEREKNFIEKHPNSIISTYILSNNLNTWGARDTKRLFRQFPEKNQGTFFGKKISDYLKETTAPEMGEKFLDIAMKDPEGEVKKLSEVKAKVILLEFWASWCLPCRKANPELVEIYKKFKSRGFEIYAVSLDTKKGQWMKAIEKDCLKWIEVSDLQKTNKAAELYGVTAIPDNFLIDQNGNVVAKKLRGDRLLKKLEELLPANTDG